MPRDPAPPPQQRAVPSDILNFPRFFAAYTPLARLGGDRLYLRSPERGDWQDWAQVRSESRGFLVPWEPTWPPDALSRAAFRRRVGRYAADWRTDQGYTFFIFRQSDGRLVGGIGLSNIRRGVAETGSLGYWIGERYARQGYMTEALRLTVDFAFDRLRLHRVEAACLPSNAASRGLLLKTGFREEGYARKYLCINGIWQDHVLFGLLREEWPSTR
ncbi:MAG TPA: GNAT family protein [Stellaceae bacterium]|jgi:ribosomal-protein-alanine N-acetyltransferase